MYSKYREAKEKLEISKKRITDSFVGLEDAIKKLIKNYQINNSNINSLKQDRQKNIASNMKENNSDLSKGYKPFLNEFEKNNNLVTNNNKQGPSILSSYLNVKKQKNAADDSITRLVEESIAQLDHLLKGTKNEDN